MRERGWRLASIWGRGLSSKNARLLGCLFIFIFSWKISAQMYGFLEFHAESPGGGNRRRSFDICKVLENSLQIQWMATG